MFKKIRNQFINKSKETFKKLILLNKITCIKTEQTVEQKDCLTKNFLRVLNKQRRFYDDKVTYHNFYNKSKVEPLCLKTHLSLNDDIL